MKLPPIVHTIRFEVPMKPRGEKRGRGTVFKQQLPDGRTVHRAGRPHPDKETAKAAAVIAFHALRALEATDRSGIALPFDGPVIANVTFRKQVPEWKSEPWKREAALAHMLFPTMKPDRDNMDKLVLDAITDTGRIWKDDAQVIGGRIWKVYAEEPSVAVEIHFLQGFTKEDWVAHQRALAVPAPVDAEALAP